MTPRFWKASQYYLNVRAQKPLPQKLSPKWKMHRGYMLINQIGLKMKDSI